MRTALVAALYTSLACLANGATGQTFGDAVADLRSGDMQKLIVHDAALAGSDTGFLTFDEQPTSLVAYEGQWVLVNFWATWCGPCRVEMPHLSTIQSEYGGEAFNVVTIATGRNQPQAMQAFMDSIGADNLPLYRDPQQALAQEFEVLGLPVTLILDPSGAEVARLQGIADWTAPEGRAVIEAMLALPTD